MLTYGDQVTATIALVNIWLIVLTLVAVTLRKLSCSAISTRQ